MVKSLPPGTSMRSKCAMLVRFPIRLYDWPDPGGFGAGHDLAAAATAAEAVHAGSIDRGQAALSCDASRDRMLLVMRDFRRVQVADQPQKRRQGLADMIGEGIFKAKAVIYHPSLGIRNTNLVWRHQAAQVRKDRPRRLQAEE